MRVPSGIDIPVSIRILNGITARDARCQVLLSIRDLTKVYHGSVRANDGISLSVEEGQVFGLLGHNGAGKTTLAHQVVGLLRPTSGSIHVDGRDAVADPRFARRVCAIQPQAQVPLAGLTPRQAIRLIGRLRGGRTEGIAARSARFAAALQIEEWLDVDGEKLSSGIKRLTSFCMTAVVPGRVAILDEPTNDVDPIRRRLLWSQIRSLADERTAVLLITHNVLEAERAVDRLAILDHGRVIAEGTPGELRSSVGENLRLELTLEPEGELGESPAFVRSMVLSGWRALCSVQPGDAGDAVNWAAAMQRAGRIEEYALVPATLEDVYVELVGRADALRADSQNKEAVRVVAA
jgi:ABC-2 type transport system ATP-binding protein